MSLAAQVSSCANNHIFLEPPMNQQASVLVVDDEPDIRELLEITLLRMGLSVACAEDYTSATRLLQSQHFDFCLTDMKLPDGDGIALVEYIQQNLADLPVAVITAHGSMELAIRAMKAGAYDFVSKPVSLEKLRQLVESGIQTSVSAPPPDALSRYQIIGESKQIQLLRETIKKFARSQAPVFIEGESGTGKELVARQIHAQGARAREPFIAVNCGAIPSELMESELFGHVKGSFSGAISDNPGLFKSADGGTLFLDEIADLPLAMQVKLLRVIQEKSIRAVGAHQEQSIDVRIISASHKDLAQLVEAGQFRQDLYYRINVIGIKAPPLRERGEDIELIARFILQKLAQENTSHYELTAGAIHALRGYRFPGNVRELENILQRACALTDNGKISEQDLNLPDSTRQGMNNGVTLLDKTTELEAEELKKALLQTRWNQSAAARQLGITLRQLRYRCEKLGLTKNSG
jgi:two-component system response regulator PilR (NtrC family)